MKGGDGRAGEGKGGKGMAGEGRGRSTCLPPRFDNPGYEPGGGKERGRGEGGREGKSRGGRERGEEGKGKGGERDLAPRKKILAPPLALIRKRGFEFPDHFNTNSATHWTM